MRKQRTRAFDHGDEGEAPAGAAGRDPIPLIEQLDSVEVSEKEEALETLEQLAVLSPELVPQLLYGTGLADRINSRVCDAKASVRIAAVSLLRTLAQVGDDGAVDHLVGEDVLTPLLDLLNKMKITVSLIDPGVRDQVHTLLRHVLGAMHELCQRSETAVNIVVQAGVLPTLVDYLDPAVVHVPVELRCASAHVLQDLVEDCAVVADAVRGNKRAMQLLHAGAESGDVLLRALCCGVRFELDSECARCVQGLLPSLALQLPQALMGLKNEASNAALEIAANESRVAKQDAPAEEEGNDGAGVEFPEVPRSQLNHEGAAAKMFTSMLQQWQHGAQAQQQALETLANVFGSMTLSSCEAKVVESVLPGLTAIVNLQLSAVEAHFGEAALASLSSLDGCVDKLQLLQLRALHCLNNALIGVSPPLLLPWGAALWLALMERLRDAATALAALDGPREEDELLDAIAQCVWSLSRTEMKLPVSPEHAALLCGTLTQRLSSVASISVAGALGSLASYFRADQQALTAVARALTQCIVETTPPLLLAESVNALIDIFSDDSTHAAFVSLQIAKPLSAVPALVKRARAGAAEEDLERLCEVADNVGPFLAYKKSN